MKPTALTPLAALLLCPLTSVHAQTPPTPAPPAPAVAPAPPRHAPDRLQGHVITADAARRTISLEHHGDVPVTVTVAPNAKIYVQGAGTVDALRVGNRVNAYGQATPDAPTLTADRITVLPSAPPRSAGKAANRTTGFHPHRVEGTITATSPALTLTTAGGITVTVTTTPTTRVETSTPGSFADIAPGRVVQVRVTGDPSAPVTSEVQVQSEHGGGRHTPRKTPDAPNAPGTSPAAAGAAGAR